MFKGKTVVITGGANGIGKAAASLFLERGANVSIWDFNEEVGKQTVSEFGVAERTLFCKVNVASMEDCVSAASATVAKFGRIDVLINNAGITRDVSLTKMDAQQWQQVMDVNLTGVFNATKSVCDYMIKQKYGRIISTSSVVAHNGNFGQTNYAATKGGVISFSKSLAKELGKYNITVNAVAPGFVETDIIKTIPDHVLQMIIFRVPLGRAGKPSDVAKAYAFLASDDAEYISGTVINVDGGLTF